MEVVVCILTTLFFAAMEIADLKIRSAKRSRSENRTGGFIILPFYANGGKDEDIMADRME